MNSRRFCALMALIFTSLLTLAPRSFGQAPPPLRIMPLGDSITFGSGGTANLGGYRGPLYTLLTSAGYTVDYIGSQTGNSASVPDQDHEGHGGWRIDQLDANMVGWLGSMADPDVVLMHIGTNDFGQNLDTVNAINRLDALILKIATLRPDAQIIVTNLMERNEPANAAIQAQFNPFVTARIAAHGAAGRRVTFLDMRAAVPLSDMPDQLHPNQAGYQKMANAWLPAIQAVVTPNGSTVAPRLVRAVGAPDRGHVAIHFSKPVADSAAVVANFSLSGGLSVTEVVIDSTKRIITLTTSPQTLGTSYTVTVNGVSDRLTPTPLAIPADSQTSFWPAIPRGYQNHVPESACYTLAASLEVPMVANFGTAAVPYSLDHRAALGPFSRVAYYVELQSPEGELRYLWA
jgi:lysophospholipase L1-like esterase